MALIELSESQKLWHFNIVMIMILGILFIAKTNPTSETFTCNENRVCTLQTKYVLPPLNRTKNFTLNAGACLEPMEYRHTGKHSTWYTYNLGLDNRTGKTTKLFKRESGKQYSYEYEENFGYKKLINEIEGFNLYKKNPSKGFLAVSHAEEGDFALWLYTWVILMTILMIWNIFDKNKGN